MHEQFFFDDIPMDLIIGFVCSCSGNDQKWEIPLKELKMAPVEVHNLLLMLRARAKNPAGPWHLTPQLKVEDSKKTHKRFMRNQRIGAVIVAIEQVLVCKRISPSRRKRLQKRRAKLKKSFET